MLSPFEKAGFAARQGARVAWYMAHYYAGRRFQSPVMDEDGRPFRPSSKPPDRQALLADMTALFRRDLENVADGRYPMPGDDDGGLRDILTRSLMFFRDLSSVDARRRERRHQEVLAPEAGGGLPRYYLQNFHYQTGGYLTEESAALYDVQVETLFTGSANVMRRQGLVPVSEFMAGRDRRKVRLLDLACGTGRFLKFVKAAWPRLAVTGIDLSEAYLEEAASHLQVLGKVDLLRGDAEAVPLKAASQDILTCIYLFHELPPKIRRVVAAQIARLLRSGGLFVLVDSLQRGDRDGYDALLEGFEAGFHEPYFSSYAKEDFPAVFARAGLEFEDAEPAFLSKVMVFRKPEKAKPGCKPQRRAG